MQRTREILSPEGQIAHMSEDEWRRLLQKETIVELRALLPVVGTRKPNQRAAAPKRKSARVPAVA